MEIPLFVLVLQIGFNAALNNRGNNGNPLIPSARFVNSGQTRRLPESDGYQPLPSRGKPASDSEQSEEYSSFEDYTFRSVRPLQSRPNQRRNDYLRYNTGPENDFSLETDPFGRINSNNYVDGLQSSSSLLRRTDPNFRRPYLRNEPSNLRQSSTSKYYRKANDDLSLEVSSLESSNPEDASRLGEEASYLRSLLSRIEQPNRRGQYYRKVTNLSPDVSPIDKLDPDEDAVNSLLSSPNRRRNYHKEYNNHQNDLRFREPSPVKDTPDAYIDTILLVTDDDKPDEIPIGRPKLGSLESTGLGNNNIYNRRHGDGLNIDVDISNNLSPIRGRSHKLTNDSPLTQKFNRKSNDNAGLKSSLNDELFPDDDKTGQLTLLHLASLENLNLDSQLLRSGDRKNHNNRKSNRGNFLRLSLSPNNKLTLDEGVATDLSELVSETLDELNLVPVTLRRSRPSNDKYNRRENNRISAEEDNLSNLPVFRLGSVDIPNAELPLRRYHELADRSNKRNLRKYENNREALKKLFDDNPIKNLVPYHEVKSNKVPNNRRHEKQNTNKRDDFPDEFSLDTLFDFRQEDHDDILDLDDNFSSDSLVLRTKNQDHLTLEPSLLRSSDENPSKSKNTDDTLHLEFPWNDQLSPNKSKTSGLRSQAALRKTKQKGSKKDTTDTLHLEFPWNDPLSPNKNKTGGLRALTQLRSPEQKDTADTLYLEFPWNDQLSPSKDKYSNLSAIRKNKSQLRSFKNKDNAKGTADTLHLEFPWNDPLSSEKDKSSKLSALRSKSQLRNFKEKDNARDTTDTLHLEFPWTDQLSPNKDKSKNLSALRKLKSQLRNSKEKDNAKDTTDVLHLEFPWNGQLSPSKDKSSNLLALRKLKSQLRNSKEKYNAKDTTDVLHLEFPWNGQPGPSKDKTSNLLALRKLKSQLRNSKEKDNAKDTTDVLHLEFPWNGQPGPSKDKTSKLSAFRKIISQLKNSKNKNNAKGTTDTQHFEFPWNDQLNSSKDKNKNLSAFRKRKSQLKNSKNKDNANDTTDTLSSEYDKSSKLSAIRSKSQLRNSKEKDYDKDTTDVLHLEFPWTDQLSPSKDKSSNLSALRKLKSQLRNSKEKDNAKDTTDVLHLEYPWNDPLSSENDKNSKLSALRSKSQLRNSKEKDNVKDTTDTLHLEFPWNDPLSSENDKGSKLSALRSKSQLKNSKEKYNAKDTTDVLHLEFPWNDSLSSENDKNIKLSTLRSKSQLRNSKEKDNAKDTTDTLHLEFPWNDQLSSNSGKAKSQLRSNKQKDNTEDSTDTLHLEFPWNDALSSDENKTGELKSQSLLRSQSDSRQDKEPKDELKQPSPDKPSKKPAVRTPDPFYVHPYLRNRNIKKHPNYFRRTYDEFTKGIRLEKLKDKPSESHLKHSDRRFNDNQSLGVLPLAREDLKKDASAVITFPSERRHERLRSQLRGIPSLLTTTERPNDTKSLLNLIRDKNVKKTYNDTIIFPKN